MSATFRHIILGDLRSYIIKYNAYKISYIRNEKWRNSDGIETEWHWIWLNGDWNVPAIQSTEWWLKGHCMNDAYQFPRNGGVSSCAHGKVIQVAHRPKQSPEYQGLHVSFIR